MGQYYKGEKIGTCENMYYIRLSQAKKLAELGARDDDGITFKSMMTDNVTRFRFPWPDEDGREKAGLFYSNVTVHDRGFTIPVPEHIEVGHCDICVGNQPRNQSGHNVNIFLPCPHSEEFARLGLRTSHGGVGQQHITIKYHAIRDGVRTTLFECARCGQLQRMSNEELAEIKTYAREHFEAIAKCSAVSEKQRQDMELMASIEAELKNKLEIIERI